MDRYELAWAAGFFDGEGWAASCRYGRGDRRRAQARVNQASSNGVPEALIRFRDALGGMGRIGGPYASNSQDLFAWEIAARHDAELLHHLLLPWLGGVKLREIANALERPAVSSRQALATDEWRAWAAGFYDGEGSTYVLAHRSHEGYRIGEIAVTQSGNGGAPEVLRRMLSILGVGHVNGPYEQQGATMSVYRLKVTAQVDIDRALSVMWPWLGAVKRVQASTVLETLRAQPALPRGNPACGNNKTHCVNGHEYATARIRPFVPRKGGEEPRASSGCLACLREYARRKREEKRRSAADDDRRSMSDVATRYLLK